LGSLVLTMRGHYFAICTLGLGIAAGQIAAGIPWIGAGSGMLTPNPPEALGDVALLLYYLALGLAITCALTFAWLLSTRFGLALNAIRDDEDKAEAMGLKTHAAKVTAWVIAAGFLGAAGALYGNVVRFIDPVQTAFAGATIGVWMILMALLGGKGTLAGPIVGAIVFQIMKELFWTYLLGWQRVALGLLIIAVAVFFPAGIVGFIRERGSAKAKEQNQ
jgi:branched-chain amino acid transport system permease protein